MAYWQQNELWPQKEPITGREVCWACWNRDHKHCGVMFDEFNHLRCDHFEQFTRRGGRAERYPGCECRFECDCVHLSEQIYADQERATRLENARQRRKFLRSLRDDEANPLRAVNPEYRPPMRGKKPQA